MFSTYHVAFESLYLINAFGCNDKSRATFVLCFIVKRAARYGTTGDFSRLGRS